MKCIALAARHKLTVVPVLDDENHFRGVITYNEIIRGIASFSSIEQPGGTDHAAGPLTRLLHEPHLADSRKQ
ncbi:MAG: hypothetical protein MZV63_54685 [Marinilabiliales bacterium]|nr:hypothetical protein [Marinilabiliales bacterium]